jgi:hypothetical protein
MSFDPYGYQDTTPPASGGPGGTPESTAAQQHLAQAMERVKLPGVFLIAVGVLNLLVALAQTGGTIYFASQSADEMYTIQLERYQQLGKSMPFFKEMAKEMRKKKPDELKTQSVSLNAVTAIALIVAALVVILGGIRMIQLRSYGLCILAAIVASVPCISPTCCCGVGALVGIWSIVVLLTPQVRMMFR